MKKQLITELGSEVFVLDSVIETKKAPEITRVLSPRKALIDMPGDVPFVPDTVYSDMCRILKQDINTWVYGPAGAGKSLPVQKACESLGRGFYRINMNGHSTDESFVGGNRIRANEESKQPEMFWLTGILEKAMLHGLDADGKVVGEAATLLIDEIGSAPAETLFVLQRVLEPEKTLVIDIDGGREVKAHPEFNVVATDNTRGTGDTLGGYAGVNPVNFATRDRFHLMISVDYDPAKEKKILLNLLGETVYKKHIANMQKLTLLVRKANTDDSISFPMSIRRLIAWSKSTIMFKSLSYGFVHSVGNFLEDDQKNAVFEIYQRVFGHRPELKKVS